MHLTMSVRMARICPREKEVLCDAISKGAKTFEEFVAADNILGLHFRCLGVGESSRDNFQRQARIREKSQHKWGVEKKAGEQETPKP